MRSRPNGRRLPTIPALAIVAVLLLPAVPAAGTGSPEIPALAPSAGGASAAAGVVVRMASPLPEAGMALASGERASRRPGLPADTAIVPLAPGEDAAAAARRLASGPGVLWAEPDYVTFPLGTATPTDPDYLDHSVVSSSGSPYAYARSWWLRRTGTPAAWARGYGTATPLRGAASSFRVAVIDTGCYLDHPDMGPNVLPGYDLFQSYTARTGIYVTDGDVTPVPPGTGGATYSFSAHGTAVAAAVAGTANGTGMVGIGQDVEVVPYKVAGIWTDGGDYGYEDGVAIMLNSAVAAAIRRAADDGCRVINLSLGSTDPSNLLREATDYARFRGAVVVAAAGNENSAVPYYPAANAGVLAVAATGLDAAGTADVRASYSNYGPHIDIAAPGNAHWLPTVPGYDADGTGGTGRPGYTFWQGTSMASPVVAGAMAFLWRAAPSLTAAQVETRILSSATDPGTPGRDDYFGSGRLDLGAAYDRLVADFPPLASPVPALPAYSPLRDVVASWPAVAGTGVSYETVLDGGPAIPATGTTRALAGLAEGPHTLAVRALTSSGGWPSGWATRTVTVDTLVPTVTAPTVSAGALSWTGSGTGTPCTYEVSADSQVLASGLASARCVPALPAGTYSFAVRATDAAGNRSGWAEAVLAWAPATGVTVSRLAGPNRFDTAVSIASATFPGWAGVTDVVVACGEDRAMADPLSAAGLAGCYNAPILLVPSVLRSGGTLPAGIEAAVSGMRDANGGRVNVHVIGGTAVVPVAVYKRLDALNGGGAIRRVAGSDRYATSVAVADAIVGAVGIAEVPGVLIANGADTRAFSDALAAAPASAATHQPLLLVRVNGVMPVVGTSLATTFAGKPRVVVNSAAWVPDAVRSAVGSPTRIANSADRVTAAVEIAQFACAAGWLDADRACVANTLPDALSGGGAMGYLRAPIVYTNATSLPSATQSFLGASGAELDRVWALGGTAVISDGVLASLRSIVE